MKLGKNMPVFTNSAVGRWAKGSRFMKIISMISIAPCQFLITSHQFKIRHPKYGSGPCKVISLCSHSSITVLNTNTKGQLAARAGVREKRKS